MKKYSIILPFCFLLLVLASGCAKKNAALVPSLPTVSVEEAATSDIQLYIYANAHAEAYEFVKITARVKGFLREINYKPGELVSADKQLFLIEPDQYKAAVDIAEAQVAYAQANYKSALADYERTKQLVPLGSKVQQDLDRDIAVRDEAAANILKAQAQLETEKINLGYTAVKSPITGKVDRNLIDLGNVVGSSAENSFLTTVARMSPLYIYFTISDTDFNKIREYIKIDINTGAKTLHDVDAPFSVGIIKGASVAATEYPFAGKLDMVSNTIDRSTGTIQVRGVIPNEDFSIFPGQICRVRIPLGDKNEEVVIRQEAICRDLNRTYIFVVDADNTAHKRYVELGYEQADGTRIVVSGLEKGERYIVGGTAKARDGKKVEIK
ncbi:MAG: efflux RND transporter periplasmic adaptor subunit [Planctomycetaceae bacterium]|nr:efflux RND transporter periplasmic adaptor subunit [Planctomycetaceae bacterium]